MKNGRIEQKNVGPLRICCMEVIGRASPTASPHPSDDEASVSDEREEMDEDGQPNLVDLLLDAEYIPMMKL